MDNEAIIQFKFVTPAIWSGADQKEAEIRIPAVKSALKFWFNLLKEPNENSFFPEKEDRKKSPLIIRCIDEDVKTLDRQSAKDLKFPDYDYFLYNMKIAKNGKDNRRGIIKENSTFKIKIINKSQCVFPDKVIRAFAYLSSVGSRSRRCYGSLMPMSIEIDGEKQNIPKNLDGFKKGIEDFLCQKKDDFTILQISGEKNNFKSAIEKCQEYLKEFRGSEKGYKKVSLGLPLALKRGERLDIKGYDRYPSPVVFKVLLLNNQYIPIAIFLKEKFLKDERVSSKYRQYGIVDTSILDDMMKPSGNRTILF